MKELSIEEKAKAYDERFEKAQKWYDINTNKGYRSIFEDIFPELKESEDERIRKALITFFQRFPYERIDAAGTNVKEAIAWLEKQGNKNMGISDTTKQKLKDNLDNALEKETPESWNEFLEKQGEQKSQRTISAEAKEALFDYENANIKQKDFVPNDEQKPADTVEPKFHEGEWITNGDYTWKIVEVNPLDYILQSQDGNIVDDTISHVDEQFHSFTIQDAKDGDVLIDKSGSRECPFIFKETKLSDIKTEMLNPLAVLGYCGIGGAGFTKGIGWGDTANCIYYPATKEQRDLLFQKMHEAGYEWDADTKKLEKDEIKIKAGRNYRCTKSHIYAGLDWHGGAKYYADEDYSLVNNGCSCFCPKYSKYEHNNLFEEVECDGCVEKQDKQKLDWSEEDKKMLQSILDEYKSMPTEKRNWLKSLKDKVQFQNRWKPSEDQMTALAEALSLANNCGEEYAFDLRTLYEQLKKLNG